MTWCEDSGSNPGASTLAAARQGPDDGKGSGPEAAVEAIKRQTLLGLIVPGALVLVGGALCCPFSFLIGVALLAFGFLLLVLLPAAAWRLFKSLPQTHTEAGLLQDASPRKSQTDGMICYTNAAFDPRETPGHLLDHVYTLESPSTTSSVTSSLKRSDLSSTCSKCRSSTLSVEGQARGQDHDLQDRGYGDPPPRYSTVIRESPLI